MIKENTVKTIAISINNKTVHMDKDWTVLQACEKIGLFIPRFCYSESLSIAGNCRMCLVEIEKSPKLMPSCAIKIHEGMKIHTKTNLVKKTRENILEFLLINHPLDCPICDQGGECDLQDQAMIYGSDRGRFKEYKRSVQDKNAGPLIKTIMTRCIHCTRCIRFATEVAGVESFGTTGRGKNMEVGTYISKLFSSELSGNVIDLCPVGALTSKPYAFTVRPWELKSVESIDVLDGLGSSIRLDSKGSDLMRVLPRSNDLINQQWISDKTRFSYDGLKNQRLHYPIQIKKTVEEGNVSKNYEAITWKDTFSLFKSELNKSLDKNKSKGVNIKGVIGPFIDQEAILSFKNLLNRLGSPDLYIQSPDNAINFGNLNLDDRSNYLLSWNEALANLKDSTETTKPDFFLIVGSNPRFEASTFNVRLRRLILQSNVNSTGNPNFKNIPLVYIGEPMDLTYPSHHIGKNLDDVFSLCEGKDTWSKSFLKAKKPLPVLGFSPLQRKDGHSCVTMLDKACYYHNKVRNELSANKGDSILLKGLKGIFGNSISSALKAPLTTTQKWFVLSDAKVNTSILHPYASTAGALDLGYYPGKVSQIFHSHGKYSEKTDFLFLLGADEKEDYAGSFDSAMHEASEGSPFVVYQGHHGDLGAKQSNLVMPTTSYVEKKGTYVNTEGFVQQTDSIGNMQVESSAQNEAHDDWKVLHALSSILSLKSDDSKTALSKFMDNISYKDILSSEIKNNGTSNVNPFSYWLKSNSKAASFIDLLAEGSRASADKILFSPNKKSQKIEKKFMKIKRKSISNEKALMILNYYCKKLELKTKGSIFGDIAPHLNQVDDVSVTNPYKVVSYKSHNLTSLKSYSEKLSLDFKGNSFIPLFDNYYQTDVISKSSITMGKASLSFKNQAWPF